MNLYRWIWYRTPAYDYREVGEKFVRSEWRRIPKPYPVDVARKIHKAFVNAGYPVCMTTCREEE